MGGREIHDLLRDEFRFSTPVRMRMQNACSASTTTATPTGELCSMSSDAICVVTPSSCAPEPGAGVRTRRPDARELGDADDLALGRYAMCALPKNGSMWCCTCCRSRRPIMTINSAGESSVKRAVDDRLGILFCTPSPSIRLERRARSDAAGRLERPSRSGSSRAPRGESALTWDSTSYLLPSSRPPSPSGTCGSHRTRRHREQGIISMPPSRSAPQDREAVEELLEGARPRGHATSEPFVFSASLDRSATLSVIAARPDDLGVGQREHLRRRATVKVAPRNAAPFTILRERVPPRRGTTCAPTRSRRSAPRSA